MKILTLLIVVSFVAWPAEAMLPGGEHQDFGNRLLKASEASVGAQFLAFPLPMSHLLKGRWQVGVDGGYSSVDAGVIKQKGVLSSVGATYAFADHWGVYGLFFHNRLAVSGGGREVLVTPFAVTGLDTPEYADFSNVDGTVQQMGLGAALVFDPLVKNEEGNSLPLYAGLIINKVKLDDVKADYRMATGANAGQAGSLDLSGDYTFPMPMFGAMYSRNLSSKWRIVPSVFVAIAAKEEPQHGIITGTSPLVFRHEGETGQAPDTGDAHFSPKVAALGATLVYRPWGLGLNLGATLFRATVGTSMYDGVKKVFQLDLSWKFGNYVR